MWGGPGGMRLIPNSTFQVTHFGILIFAVVLWTSRSVRASRLGILLHLSYMYICYLRIDVPWEFMGFLNGEVLWIHCELHITNHLLPWSHVLKSFLLFWRFEEIIALTGAIPHPIIPLTLFTHYTSCSNWYWLFMGNNRFNSTVLL